MASVVLIEKTGEEIVVSFVRPFINAVYSRGALPKTGTIESNYRYLLGEAEQPFSEANEAVTLYDLQTRGSAARSILEEAFLLRREGQGDTGFVHKQDSASSSWSFSHTIGRLPTVSLFVGGMLVDADVEASATQVSVVFPSPTSGIAVLA